MTEPLLPLVEFLLPYTGFLIPMPVVIPALAAALSMLCARFPGVQRQIAFFSLLLLAAVNALLIIIADTAAFRPCKSAAGTHP